MVTAWPTDWECVQDNAKGKLEEKNMREIQ